MTESLTTPPVSVAPELSRLADIELPPVAPWALYEGVATVFGLALILALLGGLIGYAIGKHLRSRLRPAMAEAATPASPIDDALMRLDALTTAWQAGNIKEREAAYRLVTLLRLGLGLPQLPPKAPAGIPQAAWESLLDHCSALRYRPGAAGLDAQMFSQVRAWLTTRAKAC